MDTSHLTIRLIYVTCCQSWFVLVLVSISTYDHHWHRSINLYVCGCFHHIYILHRRSVVVCCGGWWWLLCVSSLIHLVHKCYSEWYTQFWNLSYALSSHWHENFQHNVHIASLAMCNDMYVVLKVLMPIWLNAVSEIVLKQIVWNHLCMTHVVNTLCNFLQCCLTSVLYTLVLSSCWCHLLPSSPYATPFASVASAVLNQHSWWFCGQAVVLPYGPQIWSWWTDANHDLRLISTCVAPPLLINKKMWSLI